MNINFENKNNFEPKYIEHILDKLGCFDKKITIYENKNIPHILDFIFGEKIKEKALIIIPNFIEKNEKISEIPEIFNIKNYKSWKILEKYVVIFVNLT